MSEVERIRALFEHGVHEIAAGRIGPGTFLRRIHDELQSIVIDTLDSEIEAAAIKAKTTLSDLEFGTAMADIDRITVSLADLATDFERAAADAGTAAARLPSEIISRAAADANDLIAKVKNSAENIAADLAAEPNVLGKVSVVLRTLADIEARHGG